jgi:hypothetical protein
MRGVGGGGTVVATGACRLPRLLLLTACPACACCTPAALPGAEHIVLEGAEHVPVGNGGRDWYGSGKYLREWIGYLDDPSRAPGGAQQASQGQQQAGQQLQAPQ